MSSLNEKIKSLMVRVILVLSKKNAFLQFKSIALESKSEDIKYTTYTTSA